MSTIVDVAAWIIVWKAIFEVFRGRRQRIEYKAAKVEYDDSRRLENEVDETQPKWQQEQRRERHRERQYQLLMRYPIAIVTRPDSRYYRQVEQEEKDEKTPFKEKLKENWKWWLLFVVMAFITLFVMHVLSWAWMVVTDWISHS